MKKIKDSSFFELLLKKYPRSPSITLCRVPELELFSQIQLNHPVLDHCCGDGFIAKNAFPGKQIEAGIDISEKQLQSAQKNCVYDKLLWADASTSLPFSNETFATILNNSGIEHIQDLHGALAEISRVLKPSGTVYLNVLNSRYFDRWPLSNETAESYRNFQPFFHALNELEWQEILNVHNFSDISFVDYFPEPTSRILAELDYRYSSFYYKKAFSLSVAADRLLPVSLLTQRWRKIMANLLWDAEPGTGSGFMIKATKIED